MDVEPSWRRKRPVEDDEDYLASKRYISEKFFNMRISHPDMPGLHGGASPMWQGSADKAGGIGGEIGEHRREKDVPPLHKRPKSQAAGTSAVGDVPRSEAEDSSSGNLCSIFLSVRSSLTASFPEQERTCSMSKETPYTPLRTIAAGNRLAPKKQSKVDDWVRTTRHRMLADASVNSAPDLCRALILYKPVGPPAPSAASDATTHGSEERGEGGGEGGGDPTPSPQAGGDGGGETVPSASAAREGAGPRVTGAKQGGLGGSEQSAGSSTAEAAGLTGGGGRTGQSGGYGNGHANGGHRRVAGSLFAPVSQRLCTSQSGGDAAEDSVEMMQARTDNDAGRAAAAASMDAMEMDAAGDDGSGGNGSGMGSWEMAPPEPPVLTRVGTSRGAPTPELTPERAAWARAATQRRSQGHGQDPNELARGPNARPPLTPQAWAQW
ncbi:unnamed protein product [Scytosiphon promiscuus]